jgi:hypothetical protein
MSRYLGAWRKLARRLEGLESNYNGGELGPALCAHSVTGTLPEHNALRKRVLQAQGMAEAMADTVPYYVPELVVPCNCGVCEECQAPSPLH